MPRESRIQRFVSGVLTALRVPRAPSIYRLSNYMVWSTKTRGQLHLLCTLLSIIYGVYMSFMYADSKKNKILIATLSLSSVFLYGVSSVYHLHRYKRTKTHMRIRKLDQQNIIAATFVTIFCYCYGLLDFRYEWTRTLVKVQGILIFLFVIKTWTFFQRFSHAVNMLTLLILTVPPLFYLPTMCSQLSSGENSCLISGAAIMAVMTICFAFKFPDPLPRTFGYHEIMHILSLAIHLIFMYPVHYLLVNGHRM